MMDGGICDRLHVGNEMHFKRREEAIDTVYLRMATDFPLNDQVPIIYLSYSLFSFTNFEQKMDMQ